MPKYYEKTEDRSTSKPGVIKIELKNKWDKIALLKAKRKCLDCDASKHIMIKSCDSHDARVNKLNARFFLSKIQDGNKYMVTAHGLIKQKDIPSNNNGGDGSDDAGSRDDQNGTTPTSVSDNEGDEHQNNANRAELSRPGTDQPVSAPRGPTYHVAGRDAANGSSGRGGRGGRGARGGTNSGRGGSSVNSDHQRSASSESRPGTRSGGRPRNT